ncbi:MAG: hypothetical protein RPU42_14535 [Candidatus Sedimenticola sp. (ex Thyasira tokunagai)]
MFDKEMEEILQAIRDSISSISHPRFYETERGYQGEFGAELRCRLKKLVLDDYFVEHEHQKNLKEHGIKIRPDLVIHIPFEESVLDSRSEGNCVVIELKLRANQKRAIEDFANLSDMCEKLDYQMGVFINIGSNESHLSEFEGPHKERMRAFAVQLEEGEVVIYK